ncbi:MAG: NADH-quinone oxidoreductase subunit A [Bdellovibrionota bacterium]
MEKHLPNFLAGIWGLGFLISLLVFSFWVRRSRRDESGKTAFSSGEAIESKPWIKMASRYQSLVVAAAAFFGAMFMLYPVVSTFRHALEEGRGLAALVAVSLFLASLSVALAYAWTKGDLSWIRDKESRNNHGNS